MTLLGVGGQRSRSRLSSVKENGWL